MPYIIMLVLQICFVTLDSQKTDCRDEKSIKKLASMSPDLPKLVELLTLHQPKENEILLLGGLEAPDCSQTHPQSPPQVSFPWSTGVCLLQCSGKMRLAPPASIISELNKVLMGMQWGREQQFHPGRGVGQKVDDDTNRSISSIEEDFLTASEHLGDDSEDDGLRNGDLHHSLEKGFALEMYKFNARLSKTSEKTVTCNLELAESSAESTQKTCVRPTPHRAPLATDQNQEEGCPPASTHTEESAGHYATNLAESVLQDAFIRLSQDEASFVSEAAVSVSFSTCPSSRPHPYMTKKPSQQRTCSFDLPKIVIVQSPDSSEGASEWPEAQVSNVQHQDGSAKTAEMSQKEIQCHVHTQNGGHKRVEVALASAASVIGTITNPQLTEKLSLESASEENTEEGVRGATVRGDFSVSSAMCGMAQVAGAVAAVELTEKAEECSNVDSTEVHTALQGLMSFAKASTALPLHCNVAEGTSVEAFRANIAEVLHREAAEVLTQPQGYRSVAHLLETTHNKIVDGITCPRKYCLDESEVDDVINEVADSLFKHALEKAKKKKELEGAGGEVHNLQVFLQDSINTLLFDILCLTQKKISHVSRCGQESEETQEGDACVDEPATSKESKSRLGQLQQLGSLGLHSLCQLKDFSDKQQSIGAVKETLSEIPVNSIERRSRQTSLTTQSSLNSCSSLFTMRADFESRTPISCYAEDLASTVVSMATELAAICLENSTGKQPWFCALKGTCPECPDAYLMPACRTMLRRKEGQGANVASRKHRAPRLSEIKKKTEEQPELMERLVNRVVDESINPDEPQDPFALFASEVTARIMNCPELNVVDTSKTGQQRSRLQCERWSRGKASSYESIPEEEADPAGTSNTLGPGCRLGQNLSRGSSISKQSSCESITDEFSRFMVNQMETEGREFDLLLDYYAGKNASSILAAAVQQAATKKNGHLNVRASSCLSKQSSTESITEEFYRFMLRDMDKENKECGIAKTKEWNNSLFPPSPRTPFCIRQSSVPDRRSSDSRLTVNSPIKANSFDGFARNVHGDTLNIYPSCSVSAAGLCKSDSCLYQRGKTDQMTDMLIHETWSSSIESLMRKNKIIADPEDSIESEASGESQIHVQQFANRLAADIVDSGKSALGGQQDANAGISTSHPLMPTSVGERRRGFKQSHLSCSRNRSSQEYPGSRVGSGSGDCSLPFMKSPREVPLIHIEGDQRVEESLSNSEKTGGEAQEASTDILHMEKPTAVCNSSERDRPAVAVAAAAKRDKRSMSASSEESMGSWSHMTPEDDPHEETSSFIQLSEGSVTIAPCSKCCQLPPSPHAHWPIATDTSELIYTLLLQHLHSLKWCVSLDSLHIAMLVIFIFSEISSASAASISSNLRELLLVNCDLEQESVDSEIRMTLQWIAASELGLSVVYFRKSQEVNFSKFQRLVHLMSQKAWQIADLFGAVVQFCNLHSNKEEAEQSVQASLFDWLLETL
uniref:SPHK1 interactor, AKAP domain containing n=1 Tax=Oryzias sinensis TaxID=183150 RepID=A0A8C7YA72_9TELE